MNALLIFLSVLLPFTAFAGLVEGPRVIGNGGGVMACAAQVELLDLWEGRRLYGLEMSRTSETVRRRLDRAIAEWGALRGNDAVVSAVGSMARAFLVSLERGLSPYPEDGTGPSPLNTAFLAEDLEIPAPTDVMAPFIERGCSLKSVAVYNGDLAGALTGTLFIDRTLYQRMSPTDQAALFFHEAVYKYFRETYGVKDSMLARKVTACVFAGVPCAELSPAAGVTPGSSLSCATSRDRFFVTPIRLLGAVGSVRLQVTVFEGVPVPSRAFAEILLPVMTLDADGAVSLANELPNLALTARSHEAAGAMNLSPAFRLELGSDGGKLMFNGQTVRCSRL